MSDTQAQTTVTPNSATLEGRVVRTPGLLLEIGALLLDLPQNWLVIGDLSEIHENYFGTDVADSIDGGGGEDWILGGGGVDLLRGGTGHDTLFGGDDEWFDVIHGDAGNDVLVGGGGGDEMFGGDGDDILFGETTDTELPQPPGDLSGAQEVESFLRENEEIIGYVKLGLEFLHAVLTGGISGAVGFVRDWAIGWFTDLLKSALTEEVLSATATLNDEMYGGLGNDLLNGDDGRDSLFGGADNDTLNGGNSLDRLEGGAGDDVYYILYSSDDEIENLQAGASGPIIDTIIEGAGGGFDIVRTDLNYTLGSNVEGLQLLGTNHRIGTGNDLNNLMRGNAGASQLYGMAGNDTMLGTAQTGGGRSALYGGTGDDLFREIDADDLIYEYENGGFDTLEIAIDYTLMVAAAVEVIYMVGAAGRFHASDTANEIKANILANLVHGAGGNDTLRGDGGHDSLDGGQGADLIYGGDGDDSIGAHATNVMLASNTTGADTIHGDGGHDRIDGARGGDQLFGGSGDDVIAGHAVDAAGRPLWADTADRDLLDGGLGNDTLTGGAGADTLRGGQGDDLIHADYAVAIATTAGGDLADGGEGNDTIWGSEAGDTLQGGAGADSIDGSGGADQIDGGAGHDALSGGAGADTLTGGAGNDLVSGGGGGDALDGGLGDDTVTGGDENDQLSGGGGTDLLDGGTGNDTLTAGAGTATLSGGFDDDSYVLGFGHFTVTEAAGGGIDSLSTRGSVTVLGEVEQITVADTGLGNATVTAHHARVLAGDGASTITGGSGDNWLDGQGGHDTIAGGAGSDTLRGGSGNDLLTDNGQSDAFARTVNAVGVAVTTVGANPLRRGLDPSAGEGSVLLGSLRVMAANGSTTQILFERTAVVLDDFSTYPGASYTRLSGIYFGEPDFDILNLETVSETALGANLPFAPSVVEAAASAQSPLIAIVTDGALLPGDANGRNDVYVRAGTVWTQINLAADGSSIGGARQLDMSAEGGFVSFVSGHTVYIAATDGSGAWAVGTGFGAKLAAHGHAVAVQAAEDGAISLYGGGLIELRHGQTGALLARMQTTNGDVLNGKTTISDVSDDGRYVLFTSTATNAVATGNPAAYDNNLAAVYRDHLPTSVYLWDSVLGTVTRISQGTGTPEARKAAWGGVFSPDGRTLAFVSADDTLVAGDANGRPDVFLMDIPTGTVVRVSTLGSDGTEITDPASGRALGFDTAFSFVGDIRFDAAGASLTWVANNRVYRADLDLTGGARSNDWLDGGAGADTMDGGAGADTYVLDDAGDRAHDSGGTPYHTIGGLQNLDRAFVTLTGNVTFTMDGVNLSGIEEVYLEYDTTAVGPVVTGLVGDAGNNRLFGNAGANAIDGGAGADHIDGGIGRRNLDGTAPLAGGADTLTGGSGNDTIRADLGIDTVVELDGTAGGIDTLISVGRTVFLSPDPDSPVPAAYLAANIEHVVIQTTQSAYVRGSDAANQLTGNAGRDTLLGEGGLDTIMGGAGHDLIEGGSAVQGEFASGTLGGEILLGGAGNDTVHAAGPAASWGGDGNDLITLTEILPDAARVGQDNMLPVAVVSGGAGYDRVVLTAQYDDVNFRTADVWVTDAETGLARLIEDALIFSAMIVPAGGGAAQSCDFLYLFDVEEVGFTTGQAILWGDVDELMPVAPLAPVITGLGPEVAAFGSVTLISTAAGAGTVVAALDAGDRNTTFGETLSYEFLSTTGGSTATRVALTAAQAAQAFEISGDSLILKDPAVLQAAGLLGDFRWTGSDARDGDDRSAVISLRAVDARGMQGPALTIELALANFSNRYIHVVTGNAATAVIETDRRGLPSGHDTIFGQNTRDPVFGDYYGDIIHAAGGNDLIYSGGSGWRDPATTGLVELMIDSYPSGGLGYVEADAIYAGAGDDTVYALRDLTYTADATGKPLIQMGANISGDEESTADTTARDVLYTGFSYDGGTFEVIYLTDFQGADLRRMQDILALIDDVHGRYGPYDLPLTTAMIAGGNLADNLITGNALDNLLMGYSTRFGYLARDRATDDGNDTLYGGAGHDTLRGGNGDDSLFGGDGNDLVTTDGAGIAVLDGGAGDDHLRAYGNGSTLYGGLGNDTLGDFGGTDSTSLRDGSGLTTQYYAGDGDDHVLDIPLDASMYLGAPEQVWADLGSGNDRIDLLVTANATVFGGLGDDTYAFGNLSEDGWHLISRLSAPGNWQLTDAGGHDTLIIGAGRVDGSTTMDLTSFEVLDSRLLNGRFLFGAQANQITVTGALLVDAGEGNDTITAQGPQAFGTVEQMLAAGDAVTLRGGLGDDLYRLSHQSALSLAGTTIEETGSGIDTVELVGLSLLDYTLGAGVENLILTGSGVYGAHVGFGTIIDMWGDQSFSGNAAANRITLDDYSVGRLYGLDGDDTIDGGLFSDGLFGGAGADVLSAGNGSDTVAGGTGNDLLDGGLGTDLLQIARSVAQIGVTDLGGGRYAITDLSGDLGTDTVSGFERVDLNGTHYDFAELVDAAPTGLALTFGRKVDWSDDLYVSRHVRPDFATDLSSDGVLDGYFGDSDTVLLPQFSHGQGASAVGVISVTDINVRAGDTWTFGFADATGAVTGAGADRGWTVTALDAGLAASLFEFDGHSLRLRADADFAALELATRSATPNWDTAYDSNILEDIDFPDDPVLARAWIRENPHRPITLQIGVTVTDAAGLTMTQMIEVDYQRPVISLTGEQTGLWGTYGQDTLVGSGGNDVMLGDTDPIDVGQGVVYGTFGTVHATHRTDDHMSGGAGDDQLFGDLRHYTGRLVHEDGTTDLWYGIVDHASGDDTMDGGTGADTMYGGFGNDVYYVDDAGDVVVDRRSDGDNEIRASVSYVMGDQAAILRLIGTAAQGQGGDLADRIIGNASDNLLRGGAGHDTLEGGDGYDSLHGGAGNDLLIGGEARDTAIYAARIADVALTDLGGGNWQITDLRAETVAGYFGTDMLQGVELISLDGAVGTLAAAAATTLPGVQLIGLGSAREPVFGVQSQAGDVIGRVVLQPTGSFFPMDATYALGGASAAAFRLQGDLLVMHDPSLLLAGQTMTLSITVSAGARTQTTDIVVTVGSGGGVKAVSGITSGTAGSDTMDGGMGADSLLGGEGDDRLTDTGTHPAAPVATVVSAALAGYPEGWVAVRGFQLASIGDISVLAMQGLGGQPNPGTILETSPVQLWLRDGLSGREVLVSKSADGTVGNADARLLGLSSDGRYVLYQTAATNIGPDGAAMDIFRFDRLSGATEVVTTVAATAAGGQPTLGGQNGAMSANGAFVVFESDAAGYGGGTGTLPAAQVWLRDMTTGVVTQVSGGAAAGAGGAAISADGRHVVFASATDLAGGAAGTTDLYRWDRLTGTTELVSAGAVGTAADASAQGATVSGDGRFVLFTSAAQNLGGGLAATIDVFRKDMLTGTVALVSTGAYGEANADSRNAVLSADGRYVVFETQATNLVSGATSTDWKLVARDLWTGVTALVPIDHDFSYYPPRPAFSADGTRLTWVNGAEGQSVSLAALLAEGADDTLDGGAGRDTLAAGDGNDLLIGGAGDDHLSGEAGADRIEGGSGADTLLGDDGPDSLFGGDDHDRINLGLAGGYADGGNGQDTLRIDADWTDLWIDGDATLVTISHGARPFAPEIGPLGYADVTGFEMVDLNGVVGTMAAAIKRAATDIVPASTVMVSVAEPGDVVATFAVTDANSAFGDVQTLSFGTAPGGMSDYDASQLFQIDGLTLRLKAGASLALQGDFTLRLVAIGLDGLAFSKDIAFTMREGFDLTGTAGADTLTGANSPDALHGGDGADLLEGLGGHDTLSGDGGSDTLRGGAGNDVLTAGGGTDLLIGGAGNDTLTGNGWQGQAGGSMAHFEGDWWNYGFEWLDGGAVLRVTDLRDATVPGHTGVDLVSAVDAISFGAVPGEWAWVPDSIIALTPVAATELRVSATHVGGAVGAVVAELSVIDANMFLGDTPVFTFADTPGGLSAAQAATLFDLVKTTYFRTELRVRDASAAAVIDGQTQVTLVATGSDGLTITRTVTLTSERNNLLTGSALGDALDGGTGNDTLQGMGGNDTLIGGVGNDVLTGGDGAADVAVYATAWVNLGVIATGAGHTVTDLRATAQPGHLGTDNLTGVEMIRIGAQTGAIGDAIAQAASAIALTGGPLAGNAAAGAVAGILTASDANAVFGDQQVFSLANAAGALDAASAAQLFDIVTSADGTRLVLRAGVNLAAGPDSYTIAIRATGLDGLSFVQTVTVAVDTGLLLTGTADADTLSGNGGHDTLRGAEGNDLLQGGGRDDVIEGGQGSADRAVYATLWQNLAVTAAPGGHVVADLRAPGTAGHLGTDSLSGVEFLTIGGQTGTVAQAISQAPTAVQLGTTNFGQGLAAGSTITTLTAVDANAVFGDAATFRLVDAAGGLTAAQAQAMFAIVGADLRYVGSNALAHGNAMTIAIEATDSRGLTFVQQVVMTVDRVNNHLPVAGHDVASGQETEVLTVNVLANDTDDDPSDPLSLSLAPGKAPVIDSIEMMTGDGVWTTITAATPTVLLRGLEVTGADLIALAASGFTAAADGTLRFVTPALLQDYLVARLGEWGPIYGSINLTPNRMHVNFSYTVEDSFGATSTTPGAGYFAVIGTDQTLTDTAGDDVITLDMGSFIALTGGIDRLILSDGPNIVNVQGSTATVLGGSGKDSINFFSGGLVADGGAGDDNLVAHATGTIALSGGAGNDFIMGFGGAGMTVEGGAGDDTIYLHSTPGATLVYQGVTWTDLLVTHDRITDLRDPATAGHLGSDSLILAGAERLVIGGLEGRHDAAIAQAASDIALTAVEAGMVVQRGSRLATVTVTDANSVFGDRQQITFADAGGGLTAAAADALFRIVPDLTGGGARLVLRDPGALATLAQPIRLALQTTGLDGLSRIETLEFTLLSGGVAGGAGHDLVDGFAGHDSLSGGDGNDTLSGRGGDDTLDGGAGADRMLGGGGNDLMAGGAGDDTYRVDSALDRIIEAAGGGNDTVLTSVDFQLAHDAHVERLLAGEGAIGLALGGNLRDNLIVGHDGADTLTGAGGNDRLTGKAGHDLLLGGEGADTLDGGEGSDTLSGGSGANHLNGGEADDLYLVGSAGDVIVETGTGGHDTVQATVDYTLGSAARVEVLSVAAGLSHGLSLTGNGFNNRVIGRLHADTLAGGDGRDSLTGGGGDDLLSGGRGADIFVFAQHSGADRIGDFDAIEGDRFNLRSGTGFVALTVGDADGDGAGDDVLLTHADGTVAILDGDLSLALAAWNAWVI